MYHYQMLRLHIFERKQLSSLRYHDGNIKNRRLDNIKSCIYKVVENQIRKKTYKRLKKLVIWSTPFHLLLRYILKTASHCVTEIKEKNIKLIMNLPRYLDIVYLNQYLGKS